jgi:hypothetical protein
MLLPAVLQDYITEANPGRVADVFVDRIQARQTYFAIAVSRQSESQSVAGLASSAVVNASENSNCERLFYANSH